MVDMTNARAAVYALREPLVQQCPELTEDRVIRDYTVSEKTAREEAIDSFYPMAGYTIAQTVAMKIEGIHAPRQGAHDTRKGPIHTYAVY